MTKGSPRALENIDLNLLLTLDALLTERAVSRAALRLSLTQSAVSRALSRLRAAFGDEILVRTGNTMRPTRLALELVAPLRRVLGEIESLFAAHGRFEPASARRRFTLAGVDYAQVVLFGPFARHCEKAAPGVELALCPLAADSASELETGSLDALLAPRGPSGAGVVWTPLFDDRYTALVARDHSLRKLTLQSYLDLQHVLVSPWGRAGGVVDEVLAALGQVRRVALQVPSFLLLPQVLLGTRRVAAVPERMAHALLERYPLRCLELPMPVPAFTMCIGWHEVHRNDPSHAWLRSEIGRLARELPAAGRKPRSASRT